LNQINWNSIRKDIPLRTSRQIRERWHHYLCPDLDKSPFTQEEDDTILAKQREFGNSWSNISVFVPGRTDAQIRDRYCRLLVKLKRNGTGMDEVCFFISQYIFFLFAYMEIGSFTKFSSLLDQEG
jgi:hypothetical protein